MNLAEKKDIYMNAYARYDPLKLNMSRPQLKLEICRVCQIIESAHI